MTKQYGTEGPRSIYPEMCDSRSLSRCGILANALWPRLIVKCDDQGRFHGDAADVRVSCFPKMLATVYVEDITTAMEELERNGMIRRYEVRDEPYIQVLSWWDYQSYARRAYPSRYPRPRGWSDRVYGTPSVQGGDPQQSAAERPGMPPRARAQSPRTAARAGAVPSNPIQPGSTREHGAKPEKIGESSAFHDLVPRPGGQA